MDCSLCGLPTPKQPIEVAGHAFCCHGCSAVYHFFGEDILAAKSALAESQEPVLTAAGSEAFLRIDGMHCSSCEVLLQRSAEKISGILSVSTSYATSTARVIYDPNQIDEMVLPDALSLAGYRARFHKKECNKEGPDKSLLWVVMAVGLAGMVMMLNVAFFYPMNLGLVSVEELRPVGWLAFHAVPRVMCVLTTILIFVVGLPILRGAWVGIRAHVLNMDNLLTIAILAAYGFSIGQIVMGQLDLYFDVAAVIIAVVTVGRYFEKGARENATEELTSIIETWAPSARVRRDNGIVTLGADALKPGDYVIVEEGEAIAVDGTIVLGQGAVDESLLTGEPVPVMRAVGEAVLGGSVVVEGGLEIQVGAKVKSQMDHLARILWSVQSSAAGMLGMADRIARVFVPTVLLLATAVTGLMLLEGSPGSMALLAGLATLIVSCPCTFGLAVPLTTATAVSTALHHGIIITSADAFDKAPRFDTVAMDKTGTLSTGDMRVVKVLGGGKVAEYAAAVERFSSHPIAEAVSRIDLRQTATDYVAHPGKGAEAIVDGHRVVVGSRSLFARLNWEVPEELLSKVNTALVQDGVASYVGWGGSIFGAILTRDQQRPEWEQVVDRLRHDKRVVLLTGAEYSSGYDERVDESHVGVPPEAKAAVIRQLKTSGAVVMIGDGSNDAPALAEADLGIAFGLPTALAAEAADVVIPGDRLEQVFLAFDLIETTRRRIRQNIGWALLYNAIAIPLALSGMLNPLFAAVAMGSSSLLVVWNSSRPLITEERLRDLSPRTAQRGWSRMESVV